MDVTKSWQITDGYMPCINKEEETKGNAKYNSSEKEGQGNGGRGTQ